MTLEPLVFAGSEPLVSSGSRAGTTPVHSIPGSDYGSTNGSYPLLNVKGEKETKLLLLLRTLCRSFRDLHSADAKPKKTARAGEEVFA